CDGHHLPTTLGRRGAACVRYFRQNQDRVCERRLTQQNIAWRRPADDLFHSRDRKGLVRVSRVEVHPVPRCGGEAFVHGYCTKRLGPRPAKAARDSMREEPVMTVRAGLFLGVAAIAIAALVGAPPAQVSAQQPAPAGVSAGDSDLGGVVTSTNGPEAGVWVIAEAHDLPTRFIKVVVTDDQGRSVLLELL